MFHNPYEHHTVETKEALAVEAGEAIVVYKSDSGGNGKTSKETEKAVEKAVRHGPLVYIPSVDELVRPLKRHFARQAH